MGHLDIAHQDSVRYGAVSKTASDLLYGVLYADAPVPRLLIEEEG